MSADTTGEDGAPLRVLLSHRTPRPTTNPYITTLFERLRQQAGLEARPFSFRRAIFGRYDVFHAHWPEVMMSSERTSRRLARVALTAAFVGRMTLSRTPVVRTAHNLELPTGLTRAQRLLLKRIDRMTVLRVTLNQQTGSLVGGQVAVVLHGDYRDRYATLDRPPAVRGRFGYVGLVRRYKGVEQLVEAFRGLPDDDLSLSVAGKPSTDELAGEIDALASGDARITTRWEFLSDADLARAVSESELVVLPYRHMHNSGAALTALSLSRPVLVPDNAVNRDLAAEVGPGWVITFEGDLDGDDLRRALEETRRPDRTDAPDLSRRDWALAAPAHLGAYRHAVEIRRG
ncbi:glycosyltransferase involved in cell wall biosynthesis [Terracoccus luteus]|uniref:Glycosyltransferase involved in cell wall biosynthesis n=1 Tax=Terracoccus luteus TaxID=53356 RepID=A0A495XV78_9MICO|nr:glycosyltransferase [Terracoccus luteus]RKT78470.1 glycosyltransferase involved in cell wall biosynthesis [Terracoccus luteus]